MAISRRSIFRDKALKQYTQGREKDILPRFVTPPVFVFLWILMGLLLTSAVIAWLAQIPTFVAGAGVVLNQSTSTSASHKGAVAIVFLPATPALTVRAGMPVLLQISTTGQHISSKIDTVEPGVMSPSEAQQKYGLNGNLAQVITQPSIAVTVNLGVAVPVQTYAGSTISAQVQVGTRHVLSLIPGLSALIRE